MVLMLTIFALGITSLASGVEIQGHNGDGNWETLSGSLDFDLNDSSSPRHIKFVFDALIDVPGTLSLNGNKQGNYISTGDTETVVFNPYGDTSHRGIYNFSGVILDNGTTVDTSFNFTYHTLADPDQTAYYTEFFKPREIRQSNGTFITAIDESYYIPIGANRNANRDFYGESRAMIDNIINDYSSDLTGIENIQLYGSGVIRISDGDGTPLVTHLDLYPAYPTGLSTTELSNHSDRAVGFSDGAQGSVKQQWEHHAGAGSFAGSVQTALSERQIVNYNISNIQGIIEDTPRTGFVTVRTLGITNNGDTFSLPSHPDTHTSFSWSEDDEPFYPNTSFTANSVSEAVFSRGRLLDKSSNIVLDNLGSMVDLNAHSGNFDGFSEDNSSYTLEFLYVSPTYTVTFYDSETFNSSELQKNENVPSRSSVTPPVVEDKVVGDNTHVFTGWEVTPSNGNLDSVTDNIIAVAQYTVSSPDEHTVRFIRDIGNQLLEAKTVVDGETINEGDYPDPNTPEGWTFDSWSGDSTENITSDRTVYANHTAIENNHTITFRREIEDKLLGTRSIPDGESLPESEYPNPDTPLGYEFVEWMGSTQDVTSDVTIVAIHTVITIEHTGEMEEDIDIYNTVTFIDSGDFDNTHLKEEDVEYGEDATPPNVPDKTKEGTLYTFSHWDGNHRNITEDITLTAVYDTEEAPLGSHIVRFRDYDGTTIEAGDPLSPTQTITTGEDAVAPDDPTRPDNLITLKTFTFSGWDKDFTNVQEDLIVNALYIDEPIPVQEYTVEFLDYDDSILKSVSVPANGSTTPPDNPERSGYVFDGWDSIAYLNVAEDLTIRAVYQVARHNVVFNANNGDFVSGLITEQEVRHNDNAYKLAIAPTRSGYLFTGWFTEPEATNEFTFDEATGESNTPITEDITLYAGWEEDPEGGSSGDDGDGDDDPITGDCPFTWEVEIPFNYFRETLRFNSALRNLTPPEGTSLEYCRDIAIRAFHKAINDEYIKQIERKFTPSNIETSYGESGELSLINAYHQFEKAFLHLNRIVEFDDDETYQDTRNTLLDIREDMMKTYQTYLDYTEDTKLDDTGYVTFNREPVGRFADNYQKRLSQYVDLKDRVEFRQAPPESPFVR